MPRWCWHWTSGRSKSHPCTSRALRQIWNRAVMPAGSDFQNTGGVGGFSAGSATRWGAAAVAATDGGRLTVDGLFPTPPLLPPESAHPHDYDLIPRETDARDAVTLIDASSHRRI